MRLLDYSPRNNKANYCISPVPLALFVVLNKELNIGRCIKVIKSKTPTHGISEVRLNYLRTPLTNRDYLFFRITSYSALARPLSLRGAPKGRRGNPLRYQVRNPEAGWGATRCALQETRGLLRRFGDSLLAMTTERVSLVCLLDAVPKVCELMQL